MPSANASVSKRFKVYDGNAPALLAHILVSKFDDHLPLYRQGEIFAQLGVEIPRSTLIDFCGQAVATLRKWAPRCSDLVYRTKDVVDACLVVMADLHGLAHVTLQSQRGGWRKRGTRATLYTEIRGNAI